jgi:hypothetical protein
VSIKEETPNQQRKLVGALAASLGLVAIACGGDDDDASAPTAGAAGKATSEGGSSASGGKNSSMPGAGSAGKPTMTPNGGKGGMPSTTGEGGAAGAPALIPADVEPLNALLSAEYNAITAYTAGAGLINAAPNSDPLFGLAAVIVKIAVDIQAQHKLHAAALVDAIEALGSAAVVEADIAKAFKAPKALTDNPTISNVLKFAASAERAAAVAYNQVLAGFEDAQHRFLAASIEGDETQHFIVLAALVLGLADPGPNLALDTAGDVVPAAFVAKVGDVDGLNAAPVDYFP